MVPFSLTHKGDFSIVLPRRSNILSPISRAGAAVITDMLSGVVKEGTGRRAQVINRPIAGKTGTTNQYKDVLFIGFSPSIVTEYG